MVTSYCRKHTQADFFREALLLQALRSRSIGGYTTSNTMGNVMGAETSKADPRPASRPREPSKHVSRWVYVYSDGRRGTLERLFPCRKARGEKLCNNVKRRTVHITEDQDDDNYPHTSSTETGHSAAIERARQRSSLYADSDSEEAPQRRPVRYPPTIIHNPPSLFSPSISKNPPETRNEFRPSRTGSHRNSTTSQNALTNTDLDSQHSLAPPIQTNELMAEHTLHGSSLHSSSTTFEQASTATARVEHNALTTTNKSPIEPSISIDATNKLHTSPLAGVIKEAKLAHNVISAERSLSERGNVVAEILAHQLWANMRVEFTNTEKSQLSQHKLRQSIPRLLRQFALSLELENHLNKDTRPNTVAYMLLRNSVSISSTILARVEEFLGQNTSKAVSGKINKVGSIPIDPPDSIKGSINKEEYLSRSSSDVGEESSEYHTMIIPPNTFYKNCGERRSAIVPFKFAEDFFQIIKQYAGTTSSGSSSNQVIDLQSLQSQQQGSSADSAAGSASQPSIPPDQSTQLSSGQPAGTIIPRVYTISGRVLMIVESGSSHYLAQILVNGRTTREFFRELRSEYLRLRGYIRRFFSFWRFSRCDFYRFEKFDELGFAPRVPNEYPEAADPNYVYNPQPMIPIPPISSHEFKKRFDSCSWQFFCRRHFLQFTKSCHCFARTSKAHSRDVLHLLPKKLSQLDESSEQRMFFWGLYARQEISFLGILAYNIVCMSPMVWIFFMWCFVWEQKGDLQNASVPLGLMGAMLSLFWSTYLGSLRFGRD
ncbi:hypothetical protein EJ04DRAFT_550830 [Polyplosphaeria fusca]|uniref:Uncharacterized protein n=1 Tax=Polyplosphaeria fusca TaxID=682080 RepID=A0A9P4V528_9PLEO|nr:hypothetical protein EJ04DRAFT_550830 [Polyplosphaeria fusca]